MTRGGSGAVVAVDGGARVKSKTKAARLRKEFAHVRELVDVGKVCLFYICNRKQRADPLLKSPTGPAWAPLNARGVSLRCQLDCLT